MMNEQKYRSKYPDIARLLHKTAMSYAEIGRRFGVTRPCFPHDFAGHADALQKVRRADFLFSTTAPHDGYLA